MPVKFKLRMIVMLDLNASSELQLSLKLELEALLQTILPDATLKAATLPHCAGLQLYLIDEHYSLEALDAQTQQKVMNNPLYWMFCWASGHAMAKAITAGELPVMDKTLLDFGSGSGVVAIAAALAGAKQVIASDIDPMSQKAIALNVALNQCEQKVSVIGDFNDYQTIAKHLDAITVADVLYDAENKPLIDALLPLAPALYLADSRVKDFEHKDLIETESQAGETFPPLGGFDEFSLVRFFQKR